MLAESCVFDKQSQLPIYCGPQQREPPRAPLIANLRGHFAEFLNHRSPERLRLLVSPTCVSFSTVAVLQSLEAFLGHPSNDFAVVPQLGVTLGDRVTPRLSLTLGYTFFYWSVVARPGEQIGLRGPFGSVWPMDACRGQDVVIASGGIGLARILQQQLSAAGGATPGHADDEGNSSSKQIAQPNRAALKMNTERRLK